MIKNILDNLMVLAATPPDIIKAEYLPGKVGVDGVSFFTEWVVKMSQFLLAILGPLAVLLLIWNGIVIVTSRGDESKISEAKKRVSYILVALVIAVMAFTIVELISNVPDAVISELNK